MIVRPVGSATHFSRLEAINARFRKGQPSACAVKLVSHDPFQVKCRKIVVLPTFSKSKLAEFPTSAVTTWFQAFQSTVAVLRQEPKTNERTKSCIKINTEIGCYGTLSDVTNADSEVNFGWPTDKLRLFTNKQPRSGSAQQNSYSVQMT